MKKYLSLLYVSASLAYSAGGVVMLLHCLGYFPDRRETLTQDRARLCEALAIQCSVLASDQRFSLIEQCLAIVQQRDVELESIGLRRKSDQSLQAAVGAHTLSWPASETLYDDGCFSVPINAGSTKWGTLEVRFRPLYASWRKIVNPDLAWFLLLATPGFGLAFVVILRRVLTQLDPSRVVPQRVRAALDVLAEGVTLLDKYERIVLANRSFAAQTGLNVDALLGRRLSEIGWKQSDNETEPTFPWKVTTAGGVSTGSLDLRIADQEHRSFVVNSTAILDESGGQRGTLTSFADVTDIMRRKAELANMLEALSLSRDEIRRQNEDLRILATRDPLTGCANRRMFLEAFESSWKFAQSACQSLSCVMVDLDFFKSINDNHGHSMGDEVLRRTGRCLLECVRDTDVVCRYGGEEFCLLLIDTNLDDAAAAAERFRVRISELKFDDLKVTASIGVSSITLGAKDPQDLQNQADKCLYLAKRNGRNQVVRFDAVPADTVIDESKNTRTRPEEKPTVDVTIPYAAVTALVSALAYRDPETAAHSTRVADLSVLLARRHLSSRDSYIVEIAALLHDIGKIGVPDAILLKPGRLTAEEWKIMAQHDRYGAEIINACFQCDALSDIVRAHHAIYSGDLAKPELPIGREIPYGSRIITICDAYDAMVSDRPYRKGQPHEAACAELRRNAGRQFDPVLVEEFIELAGLHRTTANTHVPASHVTALSIGQQVEEIVNLLDQSDVGGIAALVGRLEITARAGGAVEISEAAQAVLHHTEGGDQDLLELLASVHGLLDLCRASHAQVIANNLLTYVRRTPLIETTTN